MWGRGYWLCSILCALMCCVRPLTATECIPAASAPVVNQVVGKFDQSLTLMSDTTETVVLGTWTRYNVDPQGNLVPQQLVLHFDDTLEWSRESFKQEYTAFYEKDSNNKVSFKLEVLKMGCQDRRELECSFNTKTGICKSRFNVSLTAEPSPPLLANKTIQADAGETVTVLCEANVGYPTGDIWWYYVPSDGSPSRRLIAPDPEMSSAGDCRQYAKSKLVKEVNKEDHMSKIRCVTKNYSQRNADFAEVEIHINGMTVATPTPTPCIGSNCTNPGGSVGDGGNGGSRLSVPLTLLFCALLSLTAKASRSDS